MITESMITQLLHFIFLALKPTELLGAAKHPFNASSAAEGWLTVFAMAALITSVILVLWLIAKRQRSEDRFRQEIAGLTDYIFDEPRQESAELSQHASAEASEEMPSEKSEEPVAIQEG
jgi:hypothetical protein